MSIIYCKDITFFNKTNNFFFQRKEGRTNPPSYLETLKMLIYILPLSYIQTYRITLRFTLCNIIPSFVEVHITVIDVSCHTIINDKLKCLHVF